MTINSSLISLLSTLPSCSETTSSLWYSVLLNKALISLVGLDLELLNFSMIYIFPFIRTFDVVYTIYSIFILLHFQQT